MYRYPNHRYHSSVELQDEFDSYIEAMPLILFDILCENREEQAIGHRNTTSMFATFSSCLRYYHLQRHLLRNERLGRLKSENYNGVSEWHEGTTLTNYSAFVDLERISSILGGLLRKLCGYLLRRGVL